MLQNFLKTLQLLLILFPAGLQAQDDAGVAGNWVGYIDADGEELRINITFSYSYEILDGTIDIPEQGAYTMPVEVLDTSENKLVFQFETGTGPATFYGTRNEKNNRITGEFDRLGEVYPFLLSKKVLANGLFPGLPETEVMIPAKAGEIGGSLLLRQEKSPLVMLVSGSGFQDRDLNIGGFRTFQKLSSDLYNEGYSSFRYDARGTGKSSGSPDAALPEMAEDLVWVIEYLKSEYAENVSGIILLGHNQGGLVASMAADGNTVDGVILAATPFLRGDEIITGQIGKISEERDIPDEVVQQNLEFQEKVYDVVRAGSGWETIENELAERLERQIQELPIDHQNALGDMSAFIQSQVDRQLETAKSRWFKSWIETEPTETIKGLDIPVLAVFGEKDTQVLPHSNKEVADSLSSSAGMSLQTSVVAEANHLFQKANSGMPGEYGMLDQEFAEGFISVLKNWMESF